MKDNAVSPYELEHLLKIIRSLVHQSTDIETPEIVRWTSKQNLYRLKSILENSIKECPSFGDLENQWLKSVEQEQIIQILSK